MLEFIGEESNRFVLDEVLRCLKKGINPQDIIDAVEAFLKSKEKVRTELDECRIKARGGDKEAARKFILLLAEENDGA